MSATTRTDNEQEIRHLMKHWEECLRKKDLDTMVKDYDEDVVVFDVGDQAKGRDAYKKLWEQCFPYFGDEIGSEKKDITIHATDEMAVVSCLSRLTGMATDEDMAKSWIRTTICFQKINGEWKNIHEHASFPVDCEKETIAYIMEEKS